jgi:hypothetical protein
MSDLGFLLCHGGLRLMMLVGDEEEYNTKLDMFHVPHVPHGACGGELD